MVEYAQNKLNQLLVFDRTHGRFRLVGSLAQTKASKSLNMSTKHPFNLQRYSVAESSYHVRQNMYPKPSNARFTTRTN